MIAFGNIVKQDDKFGIAIENPSITNFVEILWENGVLTKESCTYLEKVGAVDITKLREAVKKVAIEFIQEYKGE